MDNHILQEAARTYNTPCYIFDLDVFISRIRRMEQILGKQVNIYYAMKANPIPDSCRCPGSRRPGGLFPGRVCHLPPRPCAGPENRPFRCQ